MGQFRREHAVRCQVGDVHDGDHPHLFGRIHQGHVVQRGELPQGGGLVGEGEQAAEIGEGALEQGAVDVGVGVSVDGEGPLFLLAVGEDQLLPWKDAVLPRQRGVVAEQGLDSQAVGLSDGEERIAGADT